MTGSQKKTRFAMVPVRAAGDRRLHESDFRVLVAIAAHADKGGYAYPALPKISAACGIKRRNVQSKISALEKAGYLRRAGFQVVGTTSVRRYQVLLDDTEEASGEMLPQASGEMRGASGEMLGGHSTECRGSISGDAGGASGEMPKHTNEQTNEQTREQRESTRTSRRHAKSLTAKDGKREIGSNWQPDADDRQYAIQRGTDPDQEAEAFVLWNRKEGKTSSDWSASWRYWITNGVKRKAAGAPQAQRKDRDRDRSKLAWMFQDQEPTDSAVTIDGEVVA